ncbi:MAG: stage III sporulation protein AC [Clostridia bacterium]
MGIEIIFKIAGVGLLTAIVNSVLKKCDKEEITTFTTMAGLMIVLFMLVDMAGSLVDSIKSILRLY